MKPNDAEVPALARPRNKNRNRLKQLFVEMAKALPEPGFKIRREDGSSGPVQLTQSFIVRGGIFLYGSPADLYFETLEELCKIILVDKTWNKDSVDKLLGTHLQEVANADADKHSQVISRQSALFLKDLESKPQRWTIDLSVYGMPLNCSGLKFGLIELISAVVRSQIAMPGLVDANSDISILFARVSIDAVNESSALDRARELVGQHLLILNALCSRKAPSYTRLVLGTDQVRSMTISRMAGREEDISGATFHFKNLAVQLSREECEKLLAERGGQFVSKLLLEEHSFAKRLISAFETAGAACLERKPSLSFLLFAIALESMVLGTTNRSELTFQLSSRVAHLLCSDIPSRRSLLQTVSKLYDLRSLIVHTGKTDVSRDDLLEIQMICMAALVSISTTPDFANFQSSEELENWFRDRILA